MATAETFTEARNALMAKFCERKAELEALEKVKINTGHKKLTNRAIEGGTIRDYVGTSKALFVNYMVTYPDMHTRYMSETIDAYSYHDEQGNELGADGFIRKSRTITPTELRAILDEIIASKREHIEKLLKEYKQLGPLVEEREALQAQIDAFNEKVSYDSGLKFKSY